TNPSSRRSMRVVCSRDCATTASTIALPVHAIASGTTEAMTVSAPSAIVPAREARHTSASVARTCPTLSRSVSLGSGFFVSSSLTGERQLSPEASACLAREPANELAGARGGDELVHELLALRKGGRKVALDLGVETVVVSRGDHGDEDADRE